MRPKRAAEPPREVRIIGGLWKRTPLPVADAAGLRPTPGRVRETLFNWLGPDLSGWRCVDAFAGSGALGFEAASRGAAEVVLVENDAKLAAGLRAVRDRLHAEDRILVERADGLGWLKRARAAAYEAIFLDPPFGSGLVPAALAAAAAATAPGGRVYVEAGEAVTAPAGLGLELLRNGRAGAVHFHLFRKVGADEPG